MRIRVACPLFAATLAVSVMIQARAAELFVSNFGGDIQLAIDNAADGDTVHIEDGVYILSNELTVTNNITVQSINGSGAVIIDADGSGRCFYIAETPCLISGLTIKNGYLAEGDGAGVYCENASWSPVISNCVITANLLERDFGYSGGGVYGGTVIHCTISSNSATLGGGVSDADLYHSRIEGNLADYNGGGAYLSRLSNCTVINNQVLNQYGAGGGICESEAFFCAISGNNGQRNGGGSAYSSLYHCTVTRNTAYAGGGTYEGNEIINSIVWHNTITGDGEGGGGPEDMQTLFLPPAFPPYLSGTDMYFSETYVENSCSPELDSLDTGNITDDPQLVSFSHISPASPCLYAGTELELGGVDIDGETWNSPPSMGCDEYNGPGTVTGAIALQIDGPGLIGVNYSADYSFIVIGPATLTTVDVEGGLLVSNPVQSVELHWSTPGTYNLILTAYNDSFPGGVAMTQQVEVVSSATSAVYVSDTSGDDSNDGTSWATAKQTIQAGIDAQMIPGGSVIVSNGTYRSEAFPILIQGNPVTVESLNGAELTIIDSERSSTCIAIYAQQSVLRGFTVTHGFGSAESGYVGGIYCNEREIFIRECIITDNYGGDAGGMLGGTAVNCLFTHNESFYGGALTRSYAGNCAFACNHSVQGGAAMNGCEAWNCTVTANSSFSSAGGVSLSALYNCIVWGNSSEDGQADISDSFSQFTCSPDLVHGSQGNITNNPQLATFSHLAPSSPCIGAGNPAYAFERDIDGESWQLPPSMGCDEYAGPGTVLGEIALEIEGPTEITAGFPAAYTFSAYGPVTRTEVSFGDGTVISNQVIPVYKAWSPPGVKDLIFTAWNDDHPEGVAMTQMVTVVSLLDSTIYVNGSSGNDANTGMSWAEAKATITGGINAQMTIGGRVLVTNGTYQAVTATISFPLQLVSVEGPALTYITGARSRRGLTIGNVNAQVSGFTVFNGYNFSRGGGIYCETRLPLISNCVVTACDAFNGGGIYNGTVYNSSITGNSGDYGAGLMRSIAENCVISGNTSDWQGGGAEECILTACTLSGNSAGYSGGGASGGETHSCLIRNNSASANGGGVYGGAHFNSTIVNNESGSEGGGASYANLSNCIVYDNFYDGFPDDIAYGSAVHSCAPELTHGTQGNITNAPAFADPANSNYRLLITSPCINAGHNAFVFSDLDRDHQSRISGKTVDMGAYEFTTDFPFLSVSTDQISALTGAGYTPPDSFFDVFNSGIASLDYAISDNADWLICLPAEGSCAAERDTITVIFDTSALPDGVHRAEITVSSAAAGSPRVIQVAVEIYTPEFDHFVFSPIPSPQTNALPFTVTFRSVDANGYPVTNYSAAVEFAALKAGASGSTAVGEGTDINDYPMLTYYEDSRTQVIYTRSEIGAACLINSLALNVAVTPQQTLNNWTIRMRHTPLENYNDPAEAVWQSDWTVVYQSDTTVTSNGWNRFIFSTPFIYNGSDNLMVDFSQNNTFWTEPSGACLATATAEPRMLLYESDSGDGDPLNWSGTTPAGWTDSYIPNLMLDINFFVPVALYPSSITMDDGIWSGSVQVAATGEVWILATAKGSSGVFSDRFMLFDGGPFDTDNDGMPNEDEIIAGTNPHAKNEFFRIESAVKVADGTEITWVPRPGRSYSLYWTPDLSLPFEILHDNIPPTGSFADLFDPATQPQGFYMLKVELTPPN